MKLEFECTRTWDDLDGDEQRRRHCSDCDHPVYNLSGMSRAEARRLFQLYDEKPPCVHFVNQNGQIVHEGDPLAQLRAQRSGLRVLAGTALVASIGLSTFADGSPLSVFSPIALIFGADDCPPNRLTGAAPAGPSEFRPIMYPPGEGPDCVGVENCKAAAQQAYDEAVLQQAQRAEEPGEAYAIFKQLYTASELLTKAGIDQPPPGMHDFDRRLLDAEEDLNDIAREHRIHLHQYRQRKNYRAMAQTIRKWQAQFPDAHNHWYLEALEAERQMKDNGTWSKRFDDDPTIGPPL